MYYEVHGEGFPLVMIMGLSANSDWWEPEIIEQCSQHFKTIIFDNRGAGRTDKPEIDYSIKMFADDTAGLMDVLNIDRAHVLGVSMGGMIAQELVLNYPEKVENLILGCTHCGGSKQIFAAENILNLLTGSIEDISPEEVLQKFLPYMFTEEFIQNNPGYIESFKQRALIAPISADPYQRQINAIMGFNTYRRLKNIEAPTLVIHGKRGILVPTENGEILAEKIPGAKLLLLDNAAHLYDQPDTDKVINSTLEFLKAPVDKVIEKVV
jgi:pimeloyl-ACP methyl ester carboxylesterase